MDVLSDLDFFHNSGNLTPFQEKVLFLKWSCFSEQLKYFDLDFHLKIRFCCFPDILKINFLCFSIDNIFSLSSFSQSFYLNGFRLQIKINLKNQWIVTEVWKYSQILSGSEFQAFPTAYLLQMWCRTLPSNYKPLFSWKIKIIDFPLPEPLQTDEGSANKLINQSAFWLINLLSFVLGFVFFLLYNPNRSEFGFRIDLVIPRAFFFLILD